MGKRFKNINNMKVINEVEERDMFDILDRSLFHQVKKYDSLPVITLNK